MEDTINRMFVCCTEHHPLTQLNSTAQPVHCRALQDIHSMSQDALKQQNKLNYVTKTLTMLALHANM
jgi:hypothetical protein